MPDNTPQWTPGPYFMMEPALVCASTADHLPFILATVHEPMPGVNARKTAELFAAAPDLYDALEAATNALEMSLWHQFRQLFNDDTALIKAAISEHAVIKPARAALQKANPAKWGEPDAR